MKIIAFGDIHMATSILPKVAGLSTAELVLVTGDITNFGSRSEAKIVLNAILEHNRNLLCLAGNMDNPDVNTYLEDLGMNLHGQAHMVKRRLCVYGVGASTPTPFATPWEISEKEVQGLVHEAQLQAMELIELAEPFAGSRIPTILVSHAPPYGTSVDRLKNGRHVGSRSIRKHIETHQPDLCLCGHIHEARGNDRLGETLIINPGALMNSGWAAVTIGANTSIHFTLQ